MRIKYKCFFKNSSSCDTVSEVLSAQCSEGDPSYLIFVLASANGKSPVLSAKVSKKVASIILDTLYSEGSCDLSDFEFELEVIQNEPKRRNS